MGLRQRKSTGKPRLIVMSSRTVSDNALRRGPRPQTRRAPLLSDSEIWETLSEDDSKEFENAGADAGPSENAHSEEGRKIKIGKAKDRKKVPKKWKRVMGKKSDIIFPQQCFDGEGDAGRGNRAALLGRQEVESDGESGMGASEGDDERSGSSSPENVSMSCSLLKLFRRK